MLNTSIFPPSRPLIVHQLVQRGRPLAGALGNTGASAKPSRRTPVLPDDAKRAIQMIKQRPELAERFLFLCEVADRAPANITSACSAAQHFFPLLAGHAVEHLAVLFLDRSNRVIAKEIVSIGGSAYSVVDPGVILRRALILHAVGLILAHNHPSGDLEPSAPDRTVTKQLKSAASLVGVQVLDHLIIAGTQYTSMAERGMM